MTSQSSPKIKRNYPRIGALTAVAVILGGVATVGIANNLKASTALSTPAVASTQVAPVPNMPVNIADVVENVSSAVVSIHVTQRATLAATPQQIPEFFGRFFDEETKKRFNEQFQNRQGSRPGQRGPSRQGVGSGFVIDKAGFIVTNNHVIDKAEKITVTFKDGKKLDAKLVGTDSKTDLALLKVSASKDLSFVKFGRSQDMRVGDWVVTMGNPFGLSQTATTGIISARHRNIGAGPFDDFLQIDAAINQGNSGGPAFNLHGEVIGVNTAIFSPSGGNVGIGFAIPSSLAEKVIADLKDDGRIERGWLGVQIQAVTEEVAASLDLDKPHGALVAKVTPGSPADKAGLKRGDIIIEVEGDEVKSVRALPRIIAGIKPGTKIDAAVWRDGKSKSLTVRLGQIEQVEKVAAVAEPTQDTVIQGLELTALTQDTRRAFRIGKNINGVVITSVKPGSNAAEKGIAPGDVIVAIGNEDVTSPDQVAEKISKARSADRKSVLLLVNRDSNERFVALTLRNA